MFLKTVARGKASVHTHQTAPTRFIEAAGIRFANRRFDVTSSRSNFPPRSGGMMALR
jgi:hypothetical protein